MLDPVPSYDNKEDTCCFKNENYVSYIDTTVLKLCFIFKKKNKAENESSVTTTRYITQTQEYSDDQRTTLAKSNISNTVLSLIQSGTLAENEWENNFSSTSRLIYTTNLYTSECNRMYPERILQFLHQSTLVQQKEIVFLLNLWNTSLFTVIQIATSIIIVAMTSRTHPQQATLYMFLIKLVTRDITLTNMTILCSRQLTDRLWERYRYTYV